VLWPSLLWVLVRRRAWREILMASAVFAATVAPWLIWKSQHRLLSPGLLEYYVGYETNALQWLTSDPFLTLRILFGNALFFAAGVGPAFGTSSPVLVVLSVIFIGLAVLSGRMDQWPAAAEVTLGLYLFAVCTHPFPILRYILPLAPMVLVAMLQGVSLVWRQPAPTAGLAVIRAAAGAFLIWLLTANVVALRSFAHLPADAVHVELGVASSLSWPAFEDTVQWLKANTEPSARIAARHDPFYYLYTGRQGLRPWFAHPEMYLPFYGHPETGGREDVASELRRLNIQYLVVDQGLRGAESDYATSQIEQLFQVDSAGWVVVHESPMGLHRIYAHR